MTHHSALLTTNKEFVSKFRHRLPALTVVRAFKRSALAASLSFTLLAAAAHPLDFLTPEQRVFMMNKFLQSQDELKSRPGQTGAADGSGAAPLTAEQRVKLLNWFVTGKSGDEPAAEAAPQPAALPAQVPPLPVQPAPVAAAPARPAGAQDEAELSAAMDQWPALAQGVSFERFRDGFAIDGARYLDPEGRITSYGFDAGTGDFTYLAQTGAGQFVLKAGRAASGAEPMEIGKAESRNGMWTVVSATGKKLAGARLIPLARGFIVARDNTGYRYVPGKGMTSFAAPEGFSIAPLQSGNVSGTGYLLLERNPEQPSGGSLGALVGSFKSLGSTLGMTRKEDYALLNIDNGKLVPINIAMEDKQVQVMSACRQRNYLMAVCDRMDSYESLFQANGAPNMTHYFWRINWFNAGGRPILVSQEGGLTRVIAADLDSGKSTPLFERAMGIASFTAVQDRDGKIHVSAQMGFSTEKKEDIVELLDAAAVAAAAQ